MLADTLWENIHINQLHPIQKFQGVRISIHILLSCRFSQGPSINIQLHQMIVSEDPRFRDFQRNYLPRYYLAGTRQGR